MVLHLGAGQKGDEPLAEPIKGFESSLARELQGHHDEISGLYLLLCPDCEPKIPKTADYSPLWVEEGAGASWVHVPGHAGVPDPATPA